MRWKILIEGGRENRRDSKKWWESRYISKGASLSLIWWSWSEKAELKVIPSYPKPKWKSSSRPNECQTHN